MPSAAEYDVAIVGASLAGCAAARLFAQQGLSVALVEQHAAIDWYKRSCTHYIQACAVPVIQRLGLERPIAEAGGVRSRMEIWTRWGWIRHAPQTLPDTYGYSIRRQTLDPILRRLAAETPGVEMLLGWTAVGLVRDRGRIAGVNLRTSDEVRDLSARLVVAADGRNSPLAKLAGVPTKTQPNHRFTYYAYFRDLPSESGSDSRFWMLDPDVAYELPNEDGITLLACWIAKEKLAAFRGDRQASFNRFVEELPCGPDLAPAKQISEVFGAIDLPLHARRAAMPGLALVGDAALATDPLWGVGCGWALESAGWLVDCTAPALVSGQGVDRAARRYARLHRRALGGHHGMIADYALGRRFRMLEKLYYRAATRDPALAELVLSFGARRIGPYGLLAPWAVARTIRSNLRNARGTAQEPTTWPSGPRAGMRPGTAHSDTARRAAH